MCSRVLTTPITRLLGIRHPVIQGGLNYCGSAGLSAAVANAGGLGLITALTQPSATALLDEIRAARAMLTPDCPGALGVNLTILPTVDAALCEELVATIIDQRIPVVETSGLPPGDLITELKRNGVKVIHKSVTTRGARDAEECGVDAISLDGFECAGQPGAEDLGNWLLQAMGARELSVPFVTSGGVGDGRQLAAALALGASGVTMGTRFMATEEASIHAGIKQALVDGAVGGVVGGAALATRPDGSPNDPRPHGVRLSVWSCGPVMALIDDVPTCAQLVERMVAEAVEVIEALPASVDRHPADAGVAR